MTARFRAKAQLFIRHLIEPGEEFESDLPPGRNWEPLNDEAKAAVEKFSANIGTVVPITGQVDPPKAKDDVAIAQNWRDWTRAKRRGLARKLGAPPTIKSEDADSFIEAEVERRGQKAA